MMKKIWTSVSGLRKIATLISRDEGSCDQEVVPAVAVAVALALEPASVVASETRTPNHARYRMD